jgi:hypothetical protein
MIEIGTDTEIVTETGTGVRSALGILPDLLIRGCHSILPVLGSSYLANDPEPVLCWQRTNARGGSPVRLNFERVFFLWGKNLQHR